MADSVVLSVELRQDAPIPLNVALTCRDDQVLAVFGPSGSGKTTLLRAIAGLYRPAHARVRCGDEVWTDTAEGRHLAPHARRVGFVFQEYALFPHLTARGNVMAALGHRRGPDRRRLADRWLGAVHLTGLEGRRPAELSGGQRQRVALARALAREPRALLLDEPFAAVDRATRAELQEELAALRREVRLPIVLVTHDFDDVVRLATDVLLIDRGARVAAGPIAAVTSRTDLPWPRLLADVGSVIDARVAVVDGARGLAELAFAGGAVLVPRRDLVAGHGVRLRVPARDVILARQRPHGVSLHNILQGRVSAIEASSDDQVLVQVAIGEARILAEITRDAVERLSLAQGREVFALVKSVSIEVHGR